LTHHLSVYVNKSAEAKLSFRGRLAKLCPISQGLRPCAGLARKTKCTPFHSLLLVGQLISFRAHWSAHLGFQDIKLWTMLSSVLLWY